MKAKVIATLLIALAMAGCTSETPTTPTGDLSGFNSRASTVLVGPEWVMDQGTLQGDASNIVVLDLAANDQAYLDGHIPGARLVNWRKDISDQARPDTFDLPTREEFESLMSRLGASPDNTIVLYDDASSRIAVRMYWTLKYFGHNDVRILNGGRGAWERSGHGFSSDPPEISQSEYRVEEIQNRYLAGIDYINEHVRDPGFTLVDARPSAQYTGEAAGTRFGSSIEHLNKGHIYGAQNVLWSENFNADGTFKSAAELRELYVPHGVTTDKKIVTYCNVGIQASSPWFVLSELLGYQDVRLYDGSMTEWANDDDNYMVLGEHCM